MLQLNLVIDQFTTTNSLGLVCFERYTTTHQVFKYFKGITNELSKT